MKQSIFLVVGLLSAAGAIAASPTMASSPSRPCTSATENTWMKIDDARQELTRAGYSVRRMFVAKHCFEAYVVDAKGKRLELFLDPVSGRVVEQKDD